MMRDAAIAPAHNAIGVQTLAPAPMKAALTNANRVPRTNRTVRCAPRSLDVPIVDTMDPAGVQVEEVEDDVAAVGNRQNEEEAGSVRGCDREKAQVEYQVRPHCSRRSAVLVRMIKIPRQPAVDGTLIKRARRPSHRRHDRQHQCQDHQHHHDVDDETRTADHCSHRICDAGTIDDRRCQHAVEAKGRLGT